MSNADFVEQYYERIAADPDYRARLLADQVAVVCAEFGYTPGPDLKIEIIEQVDDTIVIMVPAGTGPGDGAGLRPTLFFGNRGFFIPDDAQNPSGGYLSERHRPPLKADAGVSAHLTMWVGNVSALGRAEGHHAAKQPRHRRTGCPTVIPQASARVAGSSRGMCMTRKEIEKQIAALKKEALACDYNTGDPHKWRVTIDNIWEDIERLEFILQCAPNKATN